MDPSISQELLGSQKDGRRGMLTGGWTHLYLVEGWWTVGRWGSERKLVPVYLGRPVAGGSPCSRRGSTEAFSVL